MKVKASVKVRCEKDGVEVQKWMGVTSKEELIKAINIALK